MKVKKRPSIIKLGANAIPEIKERQKKNIVFEVVILFRTLL